MVFRLRRVSSIQKMWAGKFELFDKTTGYPVAYSNSKKLMDHPQLGFIRTCNRPSQRRAIRRSHIIQKKMS